TGYVGLVTAACLAEMGNSVQCVDIDEDVVGTLKLGRVHIFEPGLEALVHRNAEEGRLFFTTRLDEAVAEALFVFICVGTPQGEDGASELSHVFNAAGQVGAVMENKKFLVLRSTVPVGTAERVERIIRDTLHGRGLDIEFDVISNPEFLKEGDAVNDFMKPDRIIVGTDSPEAAEMLRVLYAPYARSREKVMVMSNKSAEMTKYAANCMLASKISFINEIANICERVGADIREVRYGIGADQRIGYHFIYPGVGYGGSCFPKDVKALIHTAGQYGYAPQLLTAVDEVNERQKSLLPRKIETYFSARGGGRDKTLALWGLSFKPKTDDIREAPALTLIDQLTRAGMRIQAYDPAAGPNVRQRYADNALVRVVDRQYEALEGADALAVVTEWNQFRNPDFDRIKSMLARPVIFDGRNLYSPEHMAEIGVTHFSIGRLESA
ncbi:MAG: UDP-glucose/GDP-mannose dehydrogenase family protein, partial [Proteobacteria bacterium]|nr:UDP-glucose/GDP-mannose dehydrogenase family protein [Pseudomonadota bacterium]